MNKFLFLLKFLLIIGCNGTLRFANYFQDHMVLQRAPQTAVVWGYSDSNEVITLSMNDVTYIADMETESGNLFGDNTWTVTVPPTENPGPFNIHIEQPLTNGTITSLYLNDVLFGDVWLCSGQSNMQLTVNMIYNGSQEIADAGKYINIRMFTASLMPSDQPVEELLGIDLNWSAASPSVVGGPNWTHMSAVCWLFGRMIHQALNGRPIGLIATSWGGTAIEYWLPPQALRKCDISTVTKVEVKSVRESLTAEAALNPSNLYNSMIYPFTRMVIYGIIWYQGEANVDYNRDKYTCTFTQLITNWRQVWNTRTNNNTVATFPFGFVQLSTYTSDSNKIGGFPSIRWHQTADLGYVPNPHLQQVFMAVACDLRDDPNGIHPRFKHDVAYRLTQAARAIAYGDSSVEFMGPIVLNSVQSPNTKTVNVTYHHTKSIDVRTSDGFEICCLASDCFNDTAWQITKIVDHFDMTVAIAIPPSCHDKTLFGFRYLWRETPCPFKLAAIYSGVDPNLPSPPYYEHF